MFKKSDFIQKLIGFVLSFLPLVIILVSGLKVTIDNVSIRSSSNGKAETALIITLCLVVLASIFIPVILRSRNKILGKGAVWGSLLFYLVIIFLLLYLMTFRP